LEVERPNSGSIPSTLRKSLLHENCFKIVSEIEPTTDADDFLTSPLTG
jgi:hypothetical protein